MRFKKIIRMFEDGNVCVTGLRGRGKDMLMSNVVVRRKLPYVSNVDYKGKKAKYKPFRPLDYDIGNIYSNFIENKINPYEFPHDDGTDIYISDAGTYFPSHYCNELNKKYGGFVNFMMLSRHVGLSNVHCNAQSFGRIWDKIREQSDLFIYCNKCKVFFGFVFQVVTIYEKAESCQNRVPPFPLKRPFFNKDRIQQWELAFSNYRITHGKVDRCILFYRNKSKYDTRFFKTMLSKKEVEFNSLKEAFKIELLNDIDIIEAKKQAKLSSQKGSDVSYDEKPYKEV